MTEPQAPQEEAPAWTPEQIQSQPPDPNPDSQPLPPDFRQQLVDATIAASQLPDMAQQTYQSLGIQGNVKLAGYRESVARIMPGDLVGWNGGDSPDGSYVGNVAIYAGNREIVENFYGTVRRRKLTPQDNVFGLPVIHPGDQQQEM